METWVPIKEYQDLLLERVKDGIAKITINRPEVRNAFRPQTILELIDAFALCRADTSIGVVILTGQGPEAFCSGADLKIGHGGYIAEDACAPIFWTYRGKSARFRSRSSLWSRVTPLVAATFCTLCAISLLPLRMRASAKPAQRWARLMLDWAAVTLPGSSDKRGREKSGIFAVSMMRPKP